jgi:predicted SAM-dependent methyltransferase
MRLFRRAPAPTGPSRLHVGSGQESIPGWTNIDNRPLPGVDCVLDVRRGLPFHDVASIYAEHFLEHLSLDEGLAFLSECRRVLAEHGVLRLSTPNLDWVWATHYRSSWPSDADALRDCLQLNRAFHGWGHRFLYNGPMLAAAARSVGFAKIVFCRYGQSEVPGLAGLERHETWQDSPELPHVLIIEASGRAERTKLPKAELDEYRRDVGVR